ncbi:MAG: nucleotidyltransferase domain-containing protein [Acidobacteria bacterium]|nr:nucleotidyltransferase domain-containing protein [Acidobacteriota bacterium]
MSRLVGSHHALRVALALDQRPEGLRLAQLAAVLQVGLSSAQRAIEFLLSDGLAVRRGRRGGPIRLETAHPAAAALVQLAVRALPVEAAIDLVSRSNAAVEFAGRDSEGYMLVVRRLPDPADEARLQRALAAINADRRDSRPVTGYGHDAVRRILTESRELRDRAAAMTIVRGSVDRSFPDRTGPRAAPGRHLGKLDPSLRAPSRRALAALARSHRLARLLVFGSAVREDFRPDSDVDVLFEAEPGASPGLDGVIEIRERLEEIFGREVDLLNARFVRPRVLAQAVSEGVTLYG